jgi:hypothetical protein
MRSTLLALAALLGCAPARGPAGPSTTGALALAGARCAGGACTCRAVDDYGNLIDPKDTEEGPIADGQKRFELRTGRGFDPLRIEVAGRGGLDKRTDVVDATCGYIDLPPGQHAVRVHMRAQNPEAGQVPALFVSEFSPRFKSWYTTFQFRCGGSGPCEKGHMDDWMKEMRTVERGLFDPCGSVRIKGLRFNAERAVGTKLAELTLEFVLDVYKFPPRFPHGAPRCKGLSPSEPAE